MMNDTTVNVNCLIAILGSIHHWTCHRGNNMDLSEIAEADYKISNSTVISSCRPEVDVLQGGRMDEGYCRKWVLMMKVMCRSRLLKEKNATALHATLATLLYTGLQN